MCTLNVSQSMMAVEVNLQAFGMCGMLVLAVAYTTGKIVLCNVENSASVHMLQIGSRPTALIWSPQSKSESEQPECFRDFSSQFLPNLPPFEKGYFARDFQHWHWFCSFVNFIKL